MRVPSSYLSPDCGGVTPCCNYLAAALTLGNGSSVQTTCQGCEGHVEERPLRKFHRLAQREALQTE